DFDGAGADEEGGDHGPRDAADEVELEADDGEVDRDEDGEGDLSDAIECVGEEAAFFVDDSKTSQEGSEDEAHVEGTGDDAVGEQDTDGVGDGRCAREDIEPGLVDALDQAGHEGKAEEEECAGCGEVP